MRDFKTKLLSLYFLHELKFFFSNLVFRRELFSVFILLFSGSFLFSWIEGWSLFNSFYFSVITLSTVGFGDITPVTTMGKLLTTFYIFIGLGLIASFIGKIATMNNDFREQRRAYIQQRRAQAQKPND